MSRADDAIAALDAALATAGQDIRLQRLSGTQQIPFEVTCRAMVRGYQPSELVGAIGQQDSFVILSASEIGRKGWPGPASSASSDASDRRVPRKGDRAVINGKARTIEAAAGIYVDDELVRIEMQVKG